MYYSQQRAIADAAASSQFTDLTNLQQQKFQDQFQLQHIQYYGGASGLPSQSGPVHFNFPRQRYAPYYNRSYLPNSTSSQTLTCGTTATNLAPPPGLNSTHNSSDSGISTISQDTNTNLSLNASVSLCNQQDNSINTSTSYYNNNNNNNNNSCNNNTSTNDSTVTLQISNLDTTIDEHVLKQYLITKLKPITPILSFIFEGLAVAKIRLPSQNHAKQVVAYLHRKKVGHKRIVVSYTRDSSTMEPSTLRCQVAGLLKVCFKYNLIDHLIIT